MPDETTNIDAWLDACGAETTREWADLAESVEYGDSIGNWRIIHAPTGAIKIEPLNGGQPLVLGTISARENLKAALRQKNPDPAMTLSEQADFEDAINRPNS
jgi:hypothetical protein